MAKVGIKFGNIEVELEDDQLISEDLILLAKELFKEVAVGIK